MTDKDRDHAAEQENSAANLANLDVDDVPVSNMPETSGHGCVDEAPHNGQSDKSPDASRGRRLNRKYWLISCISGDLIQTDRLVRFAK